MNKFITKFKIASIINFILGLIFISIIPGYSAILIVAGIILLYLANLYSIGLFQASLHVLVCVYLYQQEPNWKLHLFHHFLLLSYDDNEYHQHSKILYR